MKKIKPGFYKVEKGWYFLVTYDKRGNMNVKTHEDCIEPSADELKKMSNSEPLTQGYIREQIYCNQNENNFLEKGLEQLAKSKKPEMPNPVKGLKLSLFPIGNEC